MTETGKRNIMETVLTMPSDDGSFIRSNFKQFRG